jgi:hypothetical protein
MLADLEEMEQYGWLDPEITRALFVRPLSLQDKR